MLNLRAERLNRGKTLAEMASVFSISESGLSLIERRVRVPTPAVALRIATYYGVKVTDLWPVKEPA